VCSRRQLLNDFAEKWVQESAGLLGRRLGALREFEAPCAMSSRLIALWDSDYAARWLA
jgi:hypothetical protein